MDDRNASSSTRRALWSEDRRNASTVSFGRGRGEPPRLDGAGASLRGSVECIRVRRQGVGSDAGPFCVSCDVLPIFRPLITYLRCPYALGGGA